MLASHARLALALAAAPLIGFVFFACGGDDASNGDENAPSPIGQNPEPLFRALEEDLVASCGGTNGRCHVNGTYQSAPRWLGGPDPYVSIRRYRGILPATREVGDSIVLTQVRHAGPSLTEAPNDLYRRVADWLLAEVPPPALPNTGAFVVADGFNSVNLDTVAEGLVGGRLTFLATEANGVLTLSALNFVAPTNANVRLDSPFFVILPKSGKVHADPEVNGFKGELTVPAGQAVPMFGGKMILLDWDRTGQLKVVFSKIESTPGAGTLTDCTALDAFRDHALPAMRLPVEVLPDDDQDAGGGPLGQGSCLGCHATEPPEGEGSTPALQAMDLRRADANLAEACRTARTWINFQNKDESTILLNPLGRGNPQHPMKPVADGDPIVAGIRTWVLAESER